MADLKLVVPEPDAAEIIEQVTELRAATTAVIERMQFLQRYGLTFNGLRDLDKILGYQDFITPALYRRRYARGGLASRIVEALPKATWRGGGGVIEDQDPKVSTAFEKAWHDLENRLKIWSTFQRADILAGLGRYSCILLGAPSESNWTEELPKGKPDDLKYITPYSEEDAYILEWETDKDNPRFGLPRYYQLQKLSANSLNIRLGRNTPVFAPDALMHPVHWSRVIHIAENTLDDEVFGQPVLERVWNLLDDLDKVTGGGAEAFWLRANQGVQLDVNKDMTLPPEEKVDLQQQADEYQHQIRRFLRTRGVKVTTLGSDTANFANPADAIITQIAGARGIPKRILTGSEMGELASSQDRENWRDQVNGRQFGHAGPYIVRPFADRLITYGYLPTPKKGATEYEVDWPHTQVLTEQEKSQGAKDWASTNSTQGKPVFTTDEIRDHWYDFEPLTPEEIAAEQPSAPPQLALPPGVEGQTDGTGQPVVPPQKTSPPNAGQKPEKVPVVVKPVAVKAAEQADEDAIVALLESAIRTGQVSVLDQVLGVKHEPSTPAIVMPNIEITAPTKTVQKTIRYAEMQGAMRPVEIIEEVKDAR